jgi:hypothetical protein
MVGMIGVRFVVGLLLTASVGVVMTGSAPSAIESARHPVGASYDLYASYPNAERLQGWFLRGVNEYGSATSSSGPDRTSLWFQPLPDGAFKQFATTPYRECHWDLLRWNPGSQGLLVYIETQANCYSDHTDIVFRPGIAFMPKRWAPGEHWSDAGVSDTVYSENGVPVCDGTDRWRSRVVGLATVTNDAIAVHTQTNEVQTLSPIAGAPSSSACASQTTFGWQENFYIGAGLIVRREDGSAMGSDVGLLRSTGGNTAVIRETGHQEWDSVFTSWDAKPPSNAGTVTTTTTAVAGSSVGNTIQFTYVAPAGGVKNAALTIAVPPGWTPPVTADVPGCTVATVGTVTANGQGITVSALTLPPRGQTVVSYGATAGGSCSAGDGAAASSTPGTPVWQAQVTLRAGASFTNLPSSPAITVAAAGS